MKCARCGRSILASAVAQIGTRTRPMAVGPKCARIMGLIEAKERPARIVTRSRRVAGDERQMELSL